MKQSLPGNDAERERNNPASSSSDISAATGHVFVDQRKSATEMRQLAATIDNSPRVAAQRQLSANIDNSPRMIAQRQQTATMQRAEETTSAPRQNNTGLPDNLKHGIEQLSGLPMDDVAVHYNSSRPAQLDAHAYTQGSEIHVAPGQEQHLPHEAWHVVQQKQGRVRPTLQLKGNVHINDDISLEKEADVMGAQANRYGPQNPIPDIRIDTRSGIGSRIAQRQVQVIQRYEADARVSEAATKKDQALEKIGTNDYGAALILYREVKAIVQDIYQRNATSSNTDKVYSRHTKGVSEALNALITGFHVAAQHSADDITIEIKDLFENYETQINALYDQIASGLLEQHDATALNKELEKKEKEHEKAFVQIRKKFSAAVKKYIDAQPKDDDVSYNLDKDRTSLVASSKLLPLNVDQLKIYSGKNVALNEQLKSQKGSVEKFLEKPQDETLRQDTALILLAGSETRKTQIAGLFVGDLPKQLSIFQHINKKHRTDPIEAVVKLIQDIGIDQVAFALTLIEKIGDKGSIADIDAYQDKIRKTRDNPDLLKTIGFLDGLIYISLSKLTEFAAEAGKLCSLDTIRSIWGKAAENNSVDTTLSFFKENSIPGSLTGSAAEIGLAFAQKTGKSAPEDWKKLLNISGWQKENLLALIAAFDKNDGNATAEQWAKAAQTDSTLETKPDEVRATARLNTFANEKWYDDYDTSKKGASSGKAQKKYTQLLYALLGKQDLTGLKTISFDTIRGDFLSMLVFFHRHIASFDSTTGQGFDRDKAGQGKYARSNKDHPLNTQYTELLDQESVDTRDLLQPINTALLRLQGGGKITSTGTKGGATYRTGQMGIASAGLPSHNLTILRDQQAIIEAPTTGDKAKEKEAFFKAPSLGSTPHKSRFVDDNATVTDELLKKQFETLKGKIGSGYSGKNFHDALLQNRGALVNQISAVINSISGGNQVLHAIGSEDHPSLILNVPKPRKYKYKNKDYTDTKAIVPEIATDFNAASGQAIKITERGSFGFQRPTIADTGDSVRLWPGYTPVEALLPGLKVVVENLSSKKSGIPLSNISDLDTLKTDIAQPVLYLEALKTAMRHAFIVLQEKLDSSAPDEKKRVYEWLKSRMLIKLQQAGILLEKGNTLYDSRSVSTQQDKNKHFAMTADMTDKLQEYAMLLTATTLSNTTNPNSSHTTPGKFKDTGDVYEQKVISKLSATDYRIFYLDSGEQALIAAGILANRFQEGADETSTGVRKSKYISRNPYFEIGVFGGDKRSNLEKDTSGKIVHADLSPVITEGITAPKPQSDIRKEIKDTWQDPSGNIASGKADVIPIIDITNSSIDAVVNLGKMPHHFIIVESLTKHQQLGADKFIMGRLIAVSDSKGTEGSNALVKTNFLDLAQKIVGPVANEAYNPLLSKIRANMDKVLYTDDLT